MAAPAPLEAMTLSDLQAALAKSTYQERLVYVEDFKANVDALNQNHPKVITKILEMLAIATHGIDVLQRPDRYEKRKLFDAAQLALDFLEKDVLTRLEVEEDDINVNKLKEIEEVYTKLHDKVFDFNNPEANDRYNLLRRVYESIVTTPPAEEFSLPRKLGEVEHAILIMFGEQVHRNRSGLGSIMFAFQPSDVLGEDELQRWKARMTKFAVGLLIKLAVVVHRKFNLQSVRLLHTRLPGSVFGTMGENIVWRAGEDSDEPGLQEVSGR